MNILQLKRGILHALHRVYAILYGVTHKVENKILFCSFAGRQYSDNPRAISEKMHELYPEHEIVWALYDSDNLNSYVPDYVRICRVSDKHGLRFIEERTTAFCFVTNNENDSSVYKRKGQFYVQTYHGDRIFKKVLYDASMKDKITDSYITDICIAGSDYGENTFRTAFRYQGNILKVGMPRNDILVKCDKSREVIIRNRLKIREEQSVLLYAPTFRDNLTEKQSINVDLDTVLDLLNKNGQEWICLVRAHKSSYGFNNEYADNNGIIDVTLYPDMADLLQITDFLLTDYSSCAGDFILKRKPIILTAFDKDEYERQCRALGVDMEKTGYYIATDQKQLNHYIQSLSTENYILSCEKAMSYYGVNETGNSSYTICRLIHEHYLATINRTTEPNY